MARYNNRELAIELVEMLKHSLCVEKVAAYYEIQAFVSRCVNEGMVRCHASNNEAFEVLGVDPNDPAFNQGG